MTLELRPRPRPPANGHQPPAVTPKFKEDERYIVLGIDFRGIWAADFDNAIDFTPAGQESTAARRHTKV